MDEDRYKSNRALYISSMVCFLLGFFILGYAFYIIPSVVFNINYDVNLNHFIRIEMLHQWLGMSYHACELIVVTFYLVVALVMIILAMLLSNRIDNKKLGIASQVSKATSWGQRHQGMITLFKLLLFMGGLMLIANYFGIDWE